MLFLENKTIVLTRNTQEGNGSSEFLKENLEGSMNFGYF
jgi:hypothetical protein